MTANTSDVDSPSVSGYLTDVMQAAFGNLPGLVSSLARSRNITNNEAIGYLQTTIRRILRRAETTLDGEYDTNQRARDSLAELRAEADFLRKLYRDRNAKTVELRENVVQLRAEINFLRKSLSRARAEAAAATTDDNRDVHDETVMRLQQELEDRAAELRSVRQQSQRSRQESLARCETDRQRLKDLQRTLAGTNQRLAERERDLVRLAELVHPEVSSAEDAVRKLSSLVDRYREQSQIIVDLKRARDEQAERALESIERLVSDASDSTNSEVRECANALANEAEWRERCEREISDLQARLSDSARREAALVDARERLERDGVDANEHVRTLSAELTRCRDELTRCRDESASLRDEVGKWQQEYEDSQTALSNKIRQLKRSGELNRELERRIAELSECETGLRRIRSLLAEAIALYRRHGGDTLDPEILQSFVRVYNFGQNATDDAAAVATATILATDIPTPSQAIVTQSSRPKARKRRRESTRENATPALRQRSDRKGRRLPPKAAPQEIGVGPDYPSREFLSTTSSSSSSSSSSSNSTSTSSSSNGSRKRARRNKEKSSDDDATAQDSALPQSSQQPQQRPLTPTPTISVKSDARRNAVPRRPPPSMSCNRSAAFLEELRPLQDPRLRRRMAARQRQRERQQQERRELRERLESQQIPELEDIITMESAIPSLVSPFATPNPSTELSVMPKRDILAIACRNASICAPKAVDYDISGEISEEDHVVIPQDTDDENAGIYENERDNENDNDGEKK